MFGLRLLPWEYGVRNLFRRPGRSALTLAGLTTVVFLVVLVVGFVRGLERSLAVSGEEDVVLVHALGAGENLEYSSIAASTADLLPASLQGVRRRFGQAYVSPELYLGTQVAPAKDQPRSMGLVRGVTATAYLVRRQVQLEAGKWPAAGEILVGRLAAAKLGWLPEQLGVGRQVFFEGRAWRVAGQFSAGGSVFESELWCPLPDLQEAMKRQDLSLVALTLAPGAKLGEVQRFCNAQQTLELQPTREADYYAGLVDDYRLVRGLAWLIVGLVASAGAFAGLNTMYGAVVGRVREFAMLQTIGFLRRAIALGLVQEAVLLATTGSLLATLLAVALADGVAVRFTMSAFALRIDSTAVLFGCGAGLLLGVLGAIPPAIRAMRLPVVEGLKAI